MDKAIEILSRIKRTPQDIFRYSERDFDKAISELQAHKAKIEELKEWTSKTSKFALVSDDFNTGYSQAKTDILQKLEELDK